MIIIYYILLLLFIQLTLQQYNSNNTSTYINNTNTTWHGQVLNRRSGNRVGYSVEYSIRDVRPIQEMKNEMKL